MKKTQLKALVISEEPFAYTALMEEKGFITAQIGVATLHLVEEEHYDLILSDTRLLGPQKLPTILRHSPRALVVFLSPYDLLKEAIGALVLGAFSYLALPFTEEACRHLLDKALLTLSSQASSTMTVIAQSTWMKKILKEVEHIAKSHASIFLSGESGTGKEVVAHLIHLHSTRSMQPFIKVNCAAIAAPLLESEFFGHEKGAFTGATHRKLGRFELAHQGTLLLDEVSEISLDLQPKLLRAIQEMEFERVGGTKPIRVDVRLIATSNRAMQQMLEEGKFREDLFYRLNVIPIHLPPLREHTDDILPLAQHFLHRFSLEHQLECKSLSQEAQDQLMHYSWPGNVRELGNVIERAVVLSRDPVIEAEHLGIAMPLTEKPIFSENSCKGLTIKEMEKQLILQTLKEQGSNRSHTAKALGISIRTLRNKLNSYDIRIN